MGTNYLAEVLEREGRQVKIRLEVTHPDIIYLFEGRTAALEILLGPLLYTPTDAPLKQHAGAFSSQELGHHSHRFIDTVRLVERDNPHAAAHDTIKRQVQRRLLGEVPDQGVIAAARAALEALQAVRPRGVYLIETTDPQWIEHLTPGMRWELGTYTRSTESNDRSPHDLPEIEGELRQLFAPHPVPPLLLAMWRDAVCGRFSPLPDRDAHDHRLVLKYDGPYLDELFGSYPYGEADAFLARFMPPGTGRLIFFAEQSAFWVPDGWPLEDAPILEEEDFGLVLVAASLEDYLLLVAAEQGEEARRWCQAHLSGHTAAGAAERLSGVVARIGEDAFSVLLQVSNYALSTMAIRVAGSHRLCALAPRLLEMLQQPPQTEEDEYRKPVLAQALRQLQHAPALAYLETTEW